MNDESNTKHGVAETAGFREAVSFGADPSKLMALCDELFAAYTNVFQLSGVGLPDGPDPEVCNEALRRYAVAYRRHKDHTTAAEYARAPQTVTFHRTTGLFMTQGDDPVPAPGEFVVVPPNVGPAVIWDLWHLVSHIVIKDVVAQRLAGYLVPVADKALVEALLLNPPEPADADA